MRSSILLLSIVLLNGPIRGQDVSYNRDVRPILSDKCFSCHGPDDGHREADLRLDVEEAAHEWVVVAGTPEDSELIARVTAEDPNVRMPPADSGKSLSEEEVDVLRRWVKQGAKYEGHWSFITPTRPELPSVKMTEWVHNDVDRFVLARLEADGMEPSPVADKATLIRRVSLDLTGLPPTPAEVDAFLQDQSPGAYEKVVDRLLESDTIRRNAWRSSGSTPLVMRTRTDIKRTLLDRCGCGATG